MRPRSREAVSGLVDQIVTWVQIPTWKASQEFLADQAPNLLSDPAEAAMEHLIDANPGNDAVPKYLTLLQKARSNGIKAAYDELQR